MPRNVRTLRTKQNLALLWFSHFHMFASKLSINDKTAWFRAVEDLVFLGEDALFSSFPGKLPIFVIFPSRTFHLRSLCLILSQWSAHRGGQSNRQPSTGLPAERRTPLYFLTSSRSFSVSFLGPVHLLLQSLRLNESLKQSMGERLLKSVDILLSSSLRTRAVSRAFLNQCKGAWKRGRSYVYLLICWLVNHLVCYVITTRENCNPSL